MTEQQVSTKRADHAALISAALVKGVEAAIEAGHHLAIAQAELPRPEFLAMLKEDLGISETPLPSSRPSQATRCFQNFPMGKLCHLTGRFCMR
jgi:hypothetical protein